MEEQRALSPSSVSFHYAEIRAELRWSLLSDEQQQYWSRCESTLFEGALWPLKEQTLERFLGDTLDAQVSEDELDEDDEEQEVESVKETAAKLSNTNILPSLPAQRLPRLIAISTKSLPAMRTMLLHCAWSKLQ